jgi:hypothetical protein
MRVRIGTLLTLLPCLAYSQETIALGPSTGRIDPAMKCMTSLRELRDGRVLVTDPQGGVILLIDFATGLVSRVGRRGKGPLEYVSVGPAYPLPADSSMILDMGMKRWLLLEGPRVVAHTSIPATPLNGALDLIGALPHGSVVFMREPRQTAGTKIFGKSDSSHVVRVNRRTGREDTLARVRMSAAALTVEHKPGTDSVIKWSLRRFPFAQSEQVAVFPDGWIAIARLDPYRVDWRTPDGRWIRGPLLPFEEITVDGNEKQAYTEWEERESGNPVVPVSSHSNWPATIPPFLTMWLPGPVYPTAEGLLVIQRAPTSRRRAYSYDVVNRKGRLTARVDLQESERIIGFGVRTAYVLESDSNGIEWIRRHRWSVGRARAGTTSR